MDQLLVLLAIIVIVVLAAGVSGSRHPLTKCKRCHGTGILRSVLLPWRYRQCPRCGRKGEIRGRFGSSA